MLVGKWVETSSEGATFVVGERRFEGMEKRLRGLAVKAVKKEETHLVLSLSEGSMN